MLRRLTSRARWPTVGLLVAVVMGALVWSLAIRWHPSARAFPIQGIDVDETMGPIDWWAVKTQGVDFAYLRATYNAAGRDARFAEHWRGLFAAGLRRGAIHQYSLCRLAADQAGNFVTTVPRSDDTLPAALAVDFQPGCAARPTRALVLSELRRFMAAVETHTGKRMLLMISPAFESRYQVTRDIPRPIWSTEPFFPPNYAARPWRMWQASRMRRVAGAEQAVHWDVVAP